MNGSRTSRRSRRPEAGSALLFAVFLAATMLILASAAAPSILNNGRREREQELIWRGNQYMRGIRLYFQKNGRFPQNKEELVKGTLDVHFVRKAYSDPIGSPNADWRFIYVSPSGQLTGSVKYHTLQEMAVALGGQNAANLGGLLGGAAGQQPGGAPGVAGASGARGGGAATPGTAGRGGATTGALGTTAGGPGQQTTTTTGTSTGMGLTQVPLQAVDGPVLGASLIGVASKVKKDSLLSYQGKENYFQWEFIWNPLLTRAPGQIQGQGLTGVGSPGVAGAPAGAGGAFGGAGAGGTAFPPGGAGAMGPNGPPGGAAFPRR